MSWLTDDRPVDGIQGELLLIYKILLDRQTDFGYFLCYSEFLLALAGCFAFLGLQPSAHSEFLTANLISEDFVIAERKRPALTESYWAKTFRRSMWTV